jgi:hypothetical protein
MKSLAIASLAVLSLPSIALACVPGGLFCWPSEAVVRDYLAKRYPTIEVVTLDYRSSPFGKPDDTTQRFRVEFAGTAKVRQDLYDTAGIEDLIAACRLPAGSVPGLATPANKKVVTANTEIKFKGDAALYGENGAWAGSADLLNMESADGKPLYGRPKDGLGDGALILGEGKDEEICAQVR